MNGDEMMPPRRPSDHTRDPMPVVTHYPECPVCQVAWVLRRSLSLAEGWNWYWSRDCKHKTADPVLVAP